MVDHVVLARLNFVMYCDTMLYIAVLLGMITMFLFGYLCGASRTRGASVAEVVADFGVDASTQCALEDVRSHGNCTLYVSSGGGRYHRDQRCFSLIHAREVREVTACKVCFGTLRR